MFSKSSSRATHTFSTLALGSPLSLNFSVPLTMLQLSQRLMSSTLVLFMSSLSFQSLVKSNMAHWLLL